MQTKDILNTFKHINKDRHNAIWQNLLAVRKIMATENKSLNEAKKDLEEATGKPVDLNLDSISVYYSLYALTCIKEDHEVDINFRELEVDKDYSRFKSELNHTKNNISFLANLRNFISHNSLDVSLDGQKILHTPLGNKSQVSFGKDKLDATIKNITEGMLKNGSMYKLGDDVEAFKGKKGFCFCPFGKAKDILDVDGEANFLLYDRTASVFAFNKLNEEMLANPDMKFEDLIRQLIAKTDESENAGFLKSEYATMTDLDRLIINDTIHYASFVFSSKYFDENFNYAGQRDWVENAGGEKVVEKVRHALMHGYYDVKGDQITIKTLNEEGEQELADFRSKNKRRKNDSDENIQQFIRDNRHYDSKLRDVCTISSEDLVKICEGVIDIYKENHPDEYGIEPSEEENDLNDEDEIYDE